MINDMKKEYVMQPNKNITFGARINLKSPGIKEYCEYLNGCKDAPAGCFSSNRNIALFSKICDAFEKHPSDEVLSTDVKYLSGYCNARGVVKSSRGEITDIEPSRSDDGIGPMEYLFRKLLDPKNKKVFNKLMGKEYSHAYDDWWNRNVQPIWREINDLYKVDDTIVDGLSADSYSAIFRKQFVKYKNTDEPAKPPFIQRLKDAWQVLKG